MVSKKRTAVIKSFASYLNQVREEFPHDPITREIHAIRLKFSHDRKASRLSLKEWIKQVGKEALRFTQKHHLETISPA